MRELMADTGETANLAIADGGQVVFISQVETHEPIRAFFRPGTRGPIHASGIGKALLAYHPAGGGGADRARAGAPGVHRRARSPTASGWREEMAEIRARGWAVDDEERTEGMRCIAAPIFNEFREAVAGVSISGPTVRMARARAAGLGARVRAAPTASRGRSAGRPREDRAVSAGAAREFDREGPGDRPVGCKASPSGRLTGRAALVHSVRKPRGGAS